jgi:hypothetical protein
MDDNEVFEVAVGVAVLILAVALVVLVGLAVLTTR